MVSRRRFMRSAGIGGMGLAVLPLDGLRPEPDTMKEGTVISTWRHGMAANEKAWEVIGSGGTALDAVEAGVTVAENDPDCRSVGFGGRPDRDGSVTLDACIMDYRNRCGAVSFLKDIRNATSVARKVMEETPHVMLSGEGAKEFALRMGFMEENLLTERSEQDWKQWLKESDYQPPVNIENHDTIGMLALDGNGHLAGACTTSGLAYKMHGRVGDSPIIGAGLFVDQEVGAACATGVGEMVIRTAGSAIVVELMRHGATPQQACEDAVDRIIRKHPSVEGTQVGFLALDPKGNHGAFAIHKGFNYAFTYAGHHELIDSEHRL